MALALDFPTLFPRFKGPSDSGDAMADAMEQYGLSEPKVAAMFLAQVDHESAGLTRLEESFAYTPARLYSLFKTRFRDHADAAEVIRRGQEAVANRLYAKRMGNGPEESGDGYRYRGRGIIQLTGMANYRRSGTAIKVNLVADPDKAMQWPWMAQIAAEFCQRIVPYAEAGDFTTVCRLVNGGLIGYQERRESWLRFCSLLGIEPEEKA